MNVLRSISSVSSAKCTLQKIKLKNLLSLLILVHNTTPTYFWFQKKLRPLLLVPPQKEVYVIALVVHFSTDQYMKNPMNLEQKLKQITYIQPRQLLMIMTLGQSTVHSRLHIKASFLEKV